MSQSPTPLITNAPILCATDFSKSAVAATDVAALLAKKMNRPLRLVHCTQDFVVMGDLPVFVPDDTYVREQLRLEAERLRATGLEVIEDLRRGGPSIEIIAAASEQPTQIIVLGSVGRGLADRWLIGSVAERVAESAPVPVLVTRQPDLLIEWLRGDSSLRVLCGVDLTFSSDTAIAALKMIVGLGQVEMEAASIQSTVDGPLSQELLSIRQRDVWECLHSALGDISLKVHVRDTVGAPATEFLHTADERRSSLLVVGTHQRHGLQRLKAPSFSRNTLAHATTNVLCVPAAAGERDLRIPKIRRVLVATDFTEVCTEALRYAHSLLPSGGAIRLVHVCQEPRPGVNPIIASEVYFDHTLATAKDRNDALEKFQALPQALMTVPEVAVTSEVLTHFDFAAAICEEADKFGADVICMGTRRHSRTGVALLGSTVQAVLARSQKPVLVATPRDE